MGAELLNIAVCYASDDVQFLQALQVPVGTTIGAALALSDLPARLPQLDLQTASLGLYGKKNSADTVLRAHDRIEVYRPLIGDPKQARRRRKAAA